MKPLMWRPAFSNMLYRPKKGEALTRFQAKAEKTLAKILNRKEFEEADTMVTFVMDTARKIFQKPLDQQTPDALIRMGGKLSGAYAYIGQMAARAIAERDVYKQKATELDRELTLEYLDNQYKVTEIRARVSGDLEEVREQVIIKDAIKNQWENIQDACGSMVSFIQSAIKIKEREYFQTGRMQQNV